MGVLARRPCGDGGRCCSTASGQGQGELAQSETRKRQKGFYPEPLREHSLRLLAIRIEKKKKFIVVNPLPQFGNDCRCLSDTLVCFEGCLGLMADFVKYLITRTWLYNKTQSFVILGAVKRRTDASLWSKDMVDIPRFLRKSKESRADHHSCGVNRRR